VRDRAAVRAARQQHNIGAQLAQPLNFLVVFAPVVDGDDIHDDCACA
jgi:hypothetical protein